MNSVRDIAASPTCADVSAFPRTGFLAGASDDLLSALAECSSPIDLDPGDTLFEQDDPGDALYVVASGRIEISVLSEDGRRLVLDVMAAGSVFGEIALFDPGPRTATATAIEATGVLRVRNEDLHAAIDQRPAIAADMIRLAGERMRWMSAQMGDQVFLPMPARLARRLLYLTAAQVPPSASVRMSQAQLAEFVGVSREAVSKTLSDWRRAGVVALSRNGVEVLDRLSLLRLAEQEIG